MLRGITERVCGPRRLGTGAGLAGIMRGCGCWAGRGSAEVGMGSAAEAGIASAGAPASSNMDPTRPLVGLWRTHRPVSDG